MKCIYCETDNTYKDRTDGQGKCKKCKQRFAFEPKTDAPLLFLTPKRTITSAPLTDPAFKKAVEAISENNTVFFTPRQLYYQLLRPRSKPQAYKVNSAGCYLTLFWLVALGSLPFTLAIFKLSVGLALGIAVAILALGYLSRLLLPKPLKMTRLASKAVIPYKFFLYAMLPKWNVTHGPPPKMLPDGGRLRPALRQSGAESDLSSYSFDRLLVCDKAETADMLLANNMHFETNTPIVSVDGYPQDVFESVLGMVRRNPNLKVFAVHDATPQGCLLPLQLREDPRWFPQPQVQIFDIGLRPRQIASMPGLLVQDRAAQIEVPPTDATGLYKLNRELKKRPRPARPKVELNPALRRSLTPAERKWLEEGYEAELAAFKPARLMRAIYQNFNKAVEEAQRLEEAAQSDPRGFFQTHLPGVPVAPAVALGGAGPGNLPPGMAPPRSPYPPDQGVPPDSRPPYNPPPPANPWPQTPGPQPPSSQPPGERPRQ